MTSSLQLLAIHLRVPKLERSVEFYVRRLGFYVAAQASERAELATEPGAAPILTLAEDRSAPHAPRDAAGLFHAALLFPSRARLAAWLQFTAAQGIDFEGFSDHGVSEAIYLSDPDGNGLEFYCDRPASQWPFERGELAMTTRPLAVRALLADAAPVSTTPLAGARWGHLHLRVTDLERSTEFYRTALGVNVVQRTYPGARFLAAGNYHHHVGLNTWGNPQQRQPPGAMGLATATFARADIGRESNMADPDGIQLHLQPALATA